MINSGILESYVMGIATEEEVEQVLQYKKHYPEVNVALQQIELDLENFALKNGIEPPVGTLEKIENRISEIQLRQKKIQQPFTFEEAEQRYSEPKNPYIEVESTSSHMRIHKAWRWAFAAVFVLGKIFLGFAIYYYLENRQMTEQLNELKTELKQIKGR